MSDVFSPLGYGTIGMAKRGAVAILRLQRHERLNAYTPEMGEDLAATLRMLADDESVAAIVVTGEGRVFCAGADHDCYKGPLGPSGLRIGEEDFVCGFATEIRNHPKLLIAAYNGPAVGIGVSMSLAFDMRLATPDAFLKLNFAEHGIMPRFGATFLLPHLIGLGKAKRLLLCEPKVSAQDALDIGLIDEICLPDALLDRACELGLAAAKLPADTVTKIKTALNAGIESGFMGAMTNEETSDLRGQSKR